jgi:predicted RNase H-like HicB family nuclease
MGKYNFTVVIGVDEDGMYVVEVPDLKGCYTQGATMEEAIANIKEVISLCLKTQKNNIRPSELVGGPGNGAKEAGCGAGFLSLLCQLKGTLHEFKRIKYLYV